MSARHTIKTDDLSWRAVGDEIVILDMRAMKYLSLNGTGALLWSALDDGAADDALVDLLVERFHLDEQTAQRDVESFIQDCVQLGLLA